MPANYERGSDRTEDYPWMKRDGYRVYEVVKTTAAANTAAELTAADTAICYSAVKLQHCCCIRITEQGDYDTELTTCAIGSSNIPTAAYLKDAQPDDIEILTINDYTFVLNKKQDNGNEVYAFTCST